MVEKKLPFTRERIVEIIKEHPTPFHLYDEAAIRKNAREYLKAFSKLNGFKQYFAVKALPNPAILKILKEEGMGVDCSSLPELLLAEKVGFSGDQIMFTSNDTPAYEFEKAKQLGAIINLDDFSHIDYLDENVGLPDVICMRFNPGPERSGNVIIGDPKEAKYGFTRQQIIDGYKKLKEKGVKTFGLHTMVVSNELDESCFEETAKMLFELAVQVKEQTGVEISFINLGGGIGIPYQPDQKAVSYENVSNAIKKQYDEILVKNGLGSVTICTENGRVITGPYGYLITGVRHLKDTHKKYVGTDASIANLMRPAMYGAYHHITVLGKENDEATEVYDVTGSLCENNDKFAIDRKLPKIEVGDLLAIHDTGAHGHAIGFNYNGKLRSAELLLKENGSVELIRRAETVDDHFATLQI